MSVALTPSQTVGPFFEDGLLRDPVNVIATESTRGERIRIEGRVLDGDGAGVPDGMVEVWQADAEGRYRHPADRREEQVEGDFTGFGRSGTDDDGAFWFETIKPGAVPSPSRGRQAPHLNLCVFARGLLDHLVTRMYFDDEGNDTDEVLRSVAEHRRSTLVATRASVGGSTLYRFDIVLQGEGETVFFDPR
jgi:protocatechuate 3,4-dioxygenase, alpha subunit